MEEFKVKKSFVDEIVADSRFAEEVPAELELWVRERESMEFVVGDFKYYVGYLGDCRDMDEVREIVDDALKPFFRQYVVHCNSIELMNDLKE